MELNDDKYVREIVAIISTKWTLPAMYALKDGSKRYSEIYTALPGITQKVLTQTLRRMERNGLVAREVYPTIPPRVDYELSQLGMSLLEIIVSLTTWTKTYFHHVYAAQESYDSRTLTKVRDLL